MPFLITSATHNNTALGFPQSWEVDYEPTDVPVYGEGKTGPQAIGTVDRPAPPSLPKPTPGMDPDVLLREFLKATSDPSNRHLAARQFLTESASNGWDDAGSALLIVLRAGPGGGQRIDDTHQSQWDVPGDSLVGRRSLSLPCGMAVGSTARPRLSPSATGDRD